MKKIIRRIFCAGLARILCAACGEKSPEGNQTEDYSGTYTGKRGTDEVYSALEPRSAGFEFC